MHAEASDAHELQALVDLRLVPADVRYAAAIASVVSTSGSSWKPTEVEIVKDLTSVPDHVARVSSFSRPCEWNGSCLRGNWKRSLRG